MLTPYERTELIWYYSSSAGEMGLRSGQGAIEAILQAGVLPGRYERKLSLGFAEAMLEAATRAKIIERAIHMIAGHDELALRLQYTRTSDGTSDLNEHGSRRLVDGRFTVALLLGTEPAQFAYAKLVEAGIQRGAVAWFCKIHAEKSRNKSFLTLVELFEREADAWLKHAESEYQGARRACRC
jgi:hypothetical protein